jgi:uncharacterized integral membrane protein
MRIRMFVVVAVIALLTLFTVFNWSAFAAPTSLDLLFTRVEAPLGLVMLGVVIALSLGFIAYMSFWQGSVLVEMRRANKELHQQRALAEREEQSRLAELRTQLGTEVARLDASIAQARDALGVEIRENGNSLAAALAEMDQRLAGGAPRVRVEPTAEPLV